MSDSATVGLVACQAPVSMGFSRQEYWSGFPCPPPGDLPNPGCPAMHADSLPSEPPSGGLMFYEKNLKGYCLNIQDIFRASLIAQLVKNLPAMQETWV